MATRPRVALIVEMSGVYGRRILEGIAKYQRSHQPWSVFLEERELRAPPPPWLLRHHWDGIICRSTTRRLADAFLRRNLPAVDLNDLYGDLGLPHIGSDMAAIGRLGAEHLLERGFRTFAFCGDLPLDAIAGLRASGIHERRVQAFDGPDPGRVSPLGSRQRRKISQKGYARSQSHPGVHLIC